MTEVQADKLLQEVRTIKICDIILAAIIALASIEETFNLRTTETRRDVR